MVSPPHAHTIWKKTATYLYMRFYFVEKKRSTTEHPNPIPANACPDVSYFTVCSLFWKKDTYTSKRILQHDFFSNTKHAKKLKYVVSIIIKNKK